VAAGASCESESLAPLESFQIVLRRRGQVAAPARPAAPVVAPAPKAAAPKAAAAKPVAKPAAPKAPAPKTPGPRRR
jgi:hypothetical protein